MGSRYERKHTAFALVALAGIWIIYVRPWNVETSSDNHSFSISRITSEVSFIHKFTAVKLELDTPDDLEPLTELCTSIDWVPDRTYQCDHLQGGTSNIYNLALHCVRLAIEAGATSFIPPRIWMRSKDDPVRLVTENYTDLVDLSYLFDYPHFKRSLTAACPQMAIYAYVRDVPGIPQDPRYAYIRATDLGDPKGWRKNLDNLLAAMKDSAGGPYMMTAYDYLLQYRQYFWWRPRDLAADPEGLANTFKSILHFRNDARSIAAIVLESLRQHQTELSSTDSARMPFFGAHLRTGKDLGPEWTGTDRDKQFDDYMSSASQRNFTIVYIASGAPEDVDHFVERAAKEYSSINVTTKERLLAQYDPSVLRQLQRLTSDQAAIVDFEVLMRAERYAGMHRSSFDWQLALRRHIKSEIPLDQCLKKGQHMFEDEFGHLLNPEDTWFDFFFSATWP